MQRAVISIGVRRTGGLPELQAAIQSAAEFAKWARQDQKLKATQVKLLTDEKSPVSRDRIFNCVDRIAKLGYIEQLIVYFSGHGVNSGLYEQWLLSKAPNDPGAAVDVKGSEFGARFCGIGHVVFISDACRTAAEGIQAQQVRGAGIFPNVNPNGPERPVDQFYATLVGNPAYEVKSVAESAGHYRAGYSEVLMKALRGDPDSLVDRANGGAFVRPRPLKQHLALAVPVYLQSLNPGGATQQPDARIESDPAAWIAELPTGAAAPPASVPAAPPAPAPAAKRGAIRGRAAANSPERAEKLRNATLPPLDLEHAAAGAGALATSAALDLRVALAPDKPLPERRRSVALGRPGTAARGAAQQRYESLLALGATTFGPDHMETQCGIKARGLRIREARARAAQVNVGTQDDAVWVKLPDDRNAASVLLRLVDDSYVVVPVFRDFLTGLSFDERGNLSDVWCEPSANTSRWQAYKAEADEIRRLRAVVAASTTLGVFRLDERVQARAFLERLRRVKALDPALAVYAAHALSDRRLRDEIVDMQRWLDRDLGVRIFDVAMLAFSLGKKRDRETPPGPYPFVPMLTQGWSLLDPLGITLPGGLDELRGMMRPSIWTHFTSAAAGRLNDVISQGKVD